MENSNIKLFVSYFVLLLFILACGNSNDKEKKDTNTKTGLTANSKGEMSYTVEQKEFYEKRVSFKEEFSKIEIKETEKRYKSFDDCSKFTGEFFANLDYRIDNWVAEISDINFSSDGKYGGVFLKSKYKSVIFEFKTPYTLSISSDRLSSVIKNGTPLYDRLKSLKVGDVVNFTALVFKDEEKGIKEISITMDGSLDNPDFSIKLLNISLLGSQDINLADDNSNKNIDYLPIKEKDFIELIESYYDKYNKAPNELIKSSLRKERKMELRKKYGNLVVSNWEGIVDRTGTTGDGQAWISIILPGSNIEIKTQNNRFSDISDNTLISSNSKLYNQISKLKNKDKIIFSGKFITDTKEENLNFIKEMSMTEEGSMMEPEFIMKFSNVNVNE